MTDLTQTWFSVSFTRSLRRLLNLGCLEHLPRHPAAVHEQKTVVNFLTNDYNFVQVTVLPPSSLN
ncbi:hypothetical protein Hanom_Chr08g00724731 [Helianthus anomalus]